MLPRELAFPGAQDRAGVARSIGLAPPFATTGEDALRIVSVNSQTGVRVQIHARGLNVKGEIIAHVWDHIPNTDRSVAQTDFPLGVGTVLNLAVRANAGTPIIGSTFVILQVVRGVGAAAVVLGTLLQGYITSTQGLGWPGSPILDSLSGAGALREISGTTPAMGAEFSETVPTGARWELIAIHFVLATDATAGNRQPVLKIHYPAFEIVASVSPPASTPPSTAGANHSYYQGAVLNTLTFVGFTAPLPANQVLLAGAVFQSNTTGIQAGDQFSEINYVVREWLEVP